MGGVADADIDFNEVHDVLEAGSDVIVGVIDSGVEYTLNLFTLPG